MIPCLFSIILPTHHRPQLLRRSLDSLCRQTFVDFELIIVDDTGADLPLCPELQALRGRYQYIIRDGAAGPAESRNRGLDLAQAPYVLFLDDDDT